MIPSEVCLGSYSGISSGIPIQNLPEIIQEVFKNKIYPEIPSEIPHGVPLENTAKKPSRTCPGISSWIH